MFSVLRRCKSLNLPIDLQLELFDSMVLPIMLYGCEVWGYENVELLERLHLKFLKYILGVSKFTSSAIVYGELGRYPIRDMINVRMTSFWAKTLRDTTGKLSSVLLHVADEQFRKSVLDCKWLSFIQSIFANLGLNDMFDYYNFPNQEYVKIVVRTRQHDQFIQSWNSSIQTNPKCEFYKLFKSKFEFENYLINLPSALRIPYIKFRTGNLRTGLCLLRRCPWVKRSDDLCPLCLTDIGSELHFLTNCPELINLRTKYHIQINPLPLAYHNQIAPLFSFKKFNNQIAGFCRGVYIMLGNSF